MRGRAGEICYLLCAAMVGVSLGGCSRAENKAQSNPDDEAIKLAASSVLSAKKKSSAGTYMEQTRSDWARVIQSLRNLQGQLFAQSQVVPVEDVDGLPSAGDLNSDEASARRQKALQDVLISLDQFRARIEQLDAGSFPDASVWRDTYVENVLARVAQVRLEVASLGEKSPEEQFAHITELLNRIDPQESPPVLEEDPAPTFSVNTRHR